MTRLMQEPRQLSDKALASLLKKQEHAQKLDAFQAGVTIARNAQGKLLGYNFTLPLPPGVNNRHAVVNGHMVTVASVRQYFKDVRKLLNNLELLTGELFADVTVYRARKSGDLDNYLKVLFDSLKNVAIQDDGQIIFISAKRLDDAQRPRVLVNIWRTDIAPK